ncbi:hypothetical protein TNCV_2187811 [Trichonephila clavipes]|nr:hypothetical protein TNCV_2187811 [Trichonephila clavipes]
MTDSDEVQENEGGVVGAHINNLVYETPVPSVENLFARIAVASKRICDMSGSNKELRAASLSGLPNDFWL